MIDKLAGLPTQIRQLEKRLKEMDASKVKPALVKELTDTIKNLKEMLKEKQDKKEQRAKAKEEKAQEVEAAPVGAAPTMGATAPNAVPATMPGQPEATPTTPDDQKVSCPLCGGMTFNDQAAYQQHMEFTHASDIMPTSPTQKLDKTVAAVDPVVNKVETDPKIAPGIIVPDSVKKHDEIVDKVEKDPKVAPHIVSEQGPQFKLDDTVMPIRGSESKGKVMRWDGKPNDLVYVMWESGPLKDRDTFGGYYPHDLKVDVAPAPVEAAITEDEPVCEKCVAMQQKHGDLKTNYEALLKDLQEERDIHYTQGNHSWVARLDQKIDDLKKAIEEKFPSTGFNTANEKQAAGGPRLIRQIHRATSGHGYEATEYDLANGQFKQNVPLKINETGVRMTDPTKSQFEVKYDGMDWRLVAPQEFEQWLGQWKEVNQVNTQKEGAAEYPVDPKWGPDHETSPWTCSCGAQIKSKNEGLAHFRAHHNNGQAPRKRGAAENAEELTIMDHTPPRANSGPDAGGTDSHDEFQDEWAMPVTSAIKFNVFKRELLATPANGGYDISADGKKLFNIRGKEGKPMNKKQLEFCAQIEFTRGMKQAKLIEKIASLEAGSTVFIMAHDKMSRRVKFASLEHGFRGWAPASKFAYLTKKAEPMRHGDHMDDVMGSSKSAYLCECPQGSGNMRWIQGAELLSANQPPATPESLGDIEAAGKEFTDGYFDRSKTPDTNKNPINWNGKSYFGILVNMDGNVVSGYTFEQGEEAGWDLYFTTEEDIAWNENELVYVYTADDPSQLVYQWGHRQGGLTDEQKNAKEIELTPKVMSQIKLGTKKESLKQALPPQILNRRTEVNAAPADPLLKEFEAKYPKYNNWVFEYMYPGSYSYSDGKTVVFFTPDWTNEGEVDIQITDEGANYLDGTDVPYKAPLTADQLFQIVKPFLDQKKTSSLNKKARVVHRDDGWHVLSEKGKNLGGPYKSKGQAVKRLKQVEYFKHHGSIRPFGRQAIAEAMADPYQSLTDHITDMRSRMTQVQDRIQTVPAVKTAGEETPMDLPALFEDLTHGIALLEDQLGGDDSSDPAVHKMVEELENKLWKLEEECGITPKLTEHEKAEPEHKEIVEDIEKEAKDSMSVRYYKHNNEKGHCSCKYCEKERKSLEKKAARPDPDDINNPDSPGYESDEHDLMDSFVQLKNGQFALVQSHNEGGMIEVDLLGKTPTGYKYVTDSPIPVPVSAVKRELDWDEIQALNIEHEPWPEVESTKQADQVTDETIVTNDPNAVIDPNNPAVPPAPTIQNVQPTDDDNLEVPVSAPTSPPPPGQKWVFDTQFNKYVLMPDPAAPGKQI